ncbi:hypothetical protein EYZ11_010145 [Aspergillus tanneri]|uniref:DUF7924 domain-containing protein n=1 Tax=Aspergillus tanneri TaxID=1220188 RepID=A0A4V3UNA0_9EURO|nr:hypothetical protein EYZ11_010145 [Aspergillus tanneri]
MLASKQSVFLHQSNGDKIDDDYRLQRVLGYIDSISFVSWPDTEVATPLSCPSLSQLSDMDASVCSTATSTKSKNLSYLDGAAYKSALDSRNVAVGPVIPTSYNQPEFLNEMAASVSIPKELESSLGHAMAVRDSAPNETTYYLVMPFFITEWLVEMSQLRFALSIQWKTGPLESLGEETRPLSMPKPDLTIGFNWRSLFEGQCHPPQSARPQYAFPIPGDFETALPFFALEAKSDSSEQARIQNLHTAALMLRTLRLFFQKSHGSTHEFDAKVRVLTATMTRNHVNVYGHWTQCDSTNSTFWYEHFLMSSWTLSGSKEDFYRVRKGLEAFCNWIAEDNRAWIIPSLEKMRIAS